MSKGLSAKQLRFVEEYLVDLNATQAAIRAGYSAATAKQQGSRLLTNDDVAAAIVAGRESRAERTSITADQVLQELARIGFADIRQVVNWRTGVLTSIEDDDGETHLVHCNDVALVNSSDIPDEAAAAIAEVSQTKSGALKVKLHGKLPALVKLGEHLGLFRPAPAEKPKGKVADGHAALLVRDSWADELGEDATPQ